MAYATYSEFSERYPTRVAETEVTSHFLAHAAHRLDSMLAGYFAVPFADENLTAKDLNIDLAYLMLLQRSKSPRDSEALGAAVAARVEALRSGREAMVTNSGAALHRQSVEGEVWSTTQDFKPVFDLRDESAQRIDPERLDFETREDL